MSESQTSYSTQRPQQKDQISELQNTLKPLNSTCQSILTQHSNQVVMGKACRKNMVNAESRDNRCITLRSGKISLSIINRID
ncbi:uncharacterized protein N7484_005378 [Penicillium longicatenatum]|uniref:uncharacterized protein n=1 Tax=Penicillium longicatenatum TaxID=1561947 RepID=UPI002549375A|nr:uncharacterized protein N7484_005378 [Penicillium longicatenatum]KAJ5642871.1 hypothetical protein N7484_005378 [Penicillium longicatenatum]